MNIHIDSKHLDFLQELSLFSCAIGSQLYGTAHETSDTDILYLYPESLDELQSPFFNHHQFQIKTTGVDHIFSSFRQFVRNLLQGDSTINIDVLMLTNLCEEIPAFQSLKVEMTHCYPVLKCLLGMAKRDLKSAQSLKKRQHVHRGLACYEWLRTKGTYTTDDIQRLLVTTPEVLILKEKEQALRKELNRDYDQNMIKKHLSVACQQEIIDYLLSLDRKKANYLLAKQLEANNNKAFYY